MLVGLRDGYGVNVVLGANCHGNQESGTQAVVIPQV